MNSDASADVEEEAVEEKPNHPDMIPINGRPVIPRPYPKPKPTIIPRPYPTPKPSPDDNKPSASDLWKPFLDSISDFFETKKKDFIKIMGIMNGDNTNPLDMIAKPAFATGKLPQIAVNGQKGTTLIQVWFPYISSWIPGIS